jgi:hypothetical protein
VTTLNLIDELKDTLSFNILAIEKPSNGIKFVILGGNDDRKFDAYVVTLKDL